MAKNAKRTVHKSSVTIKGEVEFFVKKAGKSFGLSVFDSKGELLTTTYGSLDRRIRNSTLTIGDMILGTKKVAKKGSKSVKNAIGEVDFQTFVQFKKFMALMNA